MHLLSFPGDNLIISNSFLSSFPICASSYCFFFKSGYIASFSRTMLSRSISQLYIPNSPSPSKTQALSSTAGEPGVRCPNLDSLGMAPRCRLNPGAEFYLFLVYSVFIFTSVPLGFSVWRLTFRPMWVFCYLEPKTSIWPMFCPGILCRPPAAHGCHFCGLSQVLFAGMKPSPVPLSPNTGKDGDQNEIRVEHTRGRDGLQALASVDSFKCEGSWWNVQCKHLWIFHQGQESFSIAAI